MGIESHATYKKFWEFLDWLLEDPSRATQPRIDKLRDGVKAMRQLAISCGQEFIVPESARELLHEDFSSKITWIDFKIKGVEKVGLWLGANHKTQDGYHVFNLEWFNEVIQGRSKKDARAIIKFYIDNDCEDIG